jgi:hypothetical protein
VIISFHKPLGLLRRRRDAIIPSCFNISRMSAACICSVNSQWFHSTIYVNAAGSEYASLMDFIESAVI